MYLKDMNSFLISKSQDKDEALIENVLMIKKIFNIDNDKSISAKKNSNLEEIKENLFEDDFQNADIQDLPQ